IMVLAMMSPVTLGYTGRELMANRGTVVVFVLIKATAIARVYASRHTKAMTILLHIAGGCRIAAFGLFQFVYGPMLMTRRAAS
ncbi:MAG: NnrS family protein, partial [Opitutaceae bacterium]|nr:NnrS family protein [Opitutaceae bacterium]